MDGQLGELYQLLLRDPTNERLAGAVADLLERQHHPRSLWASGDRNGYADFDEAFPMTAALARGAGARVTITEGPGAGKWISYPHPGDTVLGFRDRSPLAIPTPVLETAGPFVRQASLTKRQWQIIGPWLAGEEPLVKLGIRDLAPLQIGPSDWAWYYDDGSDEDDVLGSVPGSRPHWLPCEFVWVRNGWREGDLIHYASEDAARHELSQAGLWWARWQAGLCEGGEKITGIEACYDNRPLKAPSDASAMADVLAQLGQMEESE